MVHSAASPDRHHLDLQNRVPHCHLIYHYPLRVASQHLPQRPPRASCSQDSSTCCPYFPIRVSGAGSRSTERAAKELYMSSTIRGASGSETNRSRLHRRYAVRALPTRAMRCAVIARWRADDVVDFEAASQKQIFCSPLIPPRSRERSGQFMVFQSIYTLGG